MKRILIAGLMCATPLTLLADGSPWLATPGDTSIQISYSSQESNNFYMGKKKSNLPDDLSFSTWWLFIDHGLTDNLAIDFRTGYADNEFDPVGDENGMTDTTLGLTWRFNDEFLTGGPSAAIRVAATLAGDYDGGVINAIGDDADGAEAALLIGQTFGNFAVSVDLGYRYRDGKVPNEEFYNFNSYYSISQSLSLSASYHVINSHGHLDIGDPGFSPARFPETEEDIESYSLGITYNFSPRLNLGLHYGDVIDGRNTPDTHFTSLSLGFSF